MIHTTTASSQSPPTPQEDQRLSLVDKAVYLISAPAITFADVDRTPPTPSNWLVPMIFFVLVSIFSTHLLLDNPSLVHAMEESETPRDYEFTVTETIHQNDEEVR